MCTEVNGISCAARLTGVEVEIIFQHNFSGILLIPHNFRQNHSFPCAARLTDEEEAFLTFCQIQAAGNFHRGRCVPCGTELKDI